MFSLKALEIIKHYESLHDGDLSIIGLQPKMCPVGIWTVGYGRALTNPKTGKFLKGEADKDIAYSLYPDLTEAEATQMLLEDVSRFEASVRFNLRKPLTVDQVGAITSLAYNIGVGNFVKSSALRLINQGNNQLAADAILKWNKGTINGKLQTLRGLEFRRQSERHLFLHGEVKFYN